MRKKRFVPLLFLALAPALGAVAEAGEAHIDWFNLLGKVFNSAVLFGGLILLLRKPLIQMLSRKSASIHEDIVEREKSLAQSESRLEEIGRRLTAVASEVEAIKGSAEAAGREEMERLQEAGRLEAERIVALSEEEIRQRVAAAVRQVRGRIADLAIERAKKDFAAGLNESAQQKIIERNIDACRGLDEGK
ncbi:MAG: hypothetical protein JXO51_04380 [Candidatus Aminicenantes bacterium]|nr:hypothetical protein [Candidatus Aminicenantes bacterium]